MTNIRRGGALAGVLALLVGAACLPACSSSTNEDPPAPSCTNALRDDGESGIDCGGVCPTHCTGSGCVADTECSSGKCENTACAAPAGKVCGVGAPVPTCDDGQGCELDKDCKSGFCDAAKCATPPADSHTDGKMNAGETGIDCGGSVKATAPCPDGQGCTDSTDCVGTCTASVCGPIGPSDGKKNNGETDVDCGGPNAPKCANGKDCDANTDCTDDYCPDATKKCTAPRYDDGVKNGTETDVDCGGTGPGMKKCAEAKDCLADGDCNGACKTATKKCVDAPSCKPTYGADTCGLYETADGFKQHESCCTTMPVVGYSDPNQPGKTVYVDKYEITAGRMRAFIEATGGNVKGYMAAHRPARWNQGWENTLPSGNTGSLASYTVSNPTPAANLLYPGQDQYLANFRTQTSWSVVDGNYQIDVGLFYSLQSSNLFPEYTPVYAVDHAQNCFNGNGSYGYSTYWFDDATVQTYAGGVKKFYSKDQLDEKSLTCAPFGLLAAFCAWDGGQLATAEVMDNITGNTVSPVYSTGAMNGLLAPGRSNCGPGGNSFISYSDGASPCYPYFFPNDMGNTYDGSGRIAAPGRMPLDIITKNGSSWMDMIGNLQEAVLKAGETQRFDYRGYGHEWGSITHHRNQETTARMKGGAFGGRCMRFK